MIKATLPRRTAVAAFAISTALVVFSVTSTAAFSAAVLALGQGFIRIAGFGIVNFSSMLLLLCVVLSVGRTGRLRIGGANARPEFSRIGWLSMLFAAGRERCASVLALYTIIPIQHR